MKTFLHIFCLILILFSSDAFAQNAATKTPKNVRFKTAEDVERSANVIRKHEKEIRSFFMQMVLRKAQMDIVSVLSAKKISESEIQKVMESDAMKNFLSRLEKNPQIQEKVDHYVQKLTKKGAIETYVMKKRDELEKKMQEDALIAYANLNNSNRLIIEEKVHEKQDERTLASKVWDHLVEDLYKD